MRKTVQKSERVLDYLTFGQERRIQVFFVCGKGGGDIGFLCSHIGMGIAVNNFGAEIYSRF